MSNYCLSIHDYVYDESGKLKVHIATVPVGDCKIQDDANYTFESLVSNPPQKFTDLKVTNYKGMLYFMKFKKDRKNVLLNVVFNTDLGLEEAEKEYLPIFEEYIRAKVPFRFKYKKKLAQRVERILSDNRAGA